MLAAKHTASSATALRLTQDELYWAQFAEAAGWYPQVEGMWLRPARPGEVLDYGDPDGPGEIKAPTAFAACQLDGLGPKAEHTPDDNAAQLTVEGLADAMRANRHDCTETVLAALGFPVAFQKANQDAAVKIARQDSVTHLSGHPVVDQEETTVAGMREVVGGIMPTLQNCIAVLRHQTHADGTRIYSDKQINRYMRRVVHLAGKDWLSILPAVN